MRTELLRVALALAAVIGAAGCPGELEQPAQWNGALCEDVVTELFPRRCAGSGCHSGDAPAAGLDLVAPGVEDRLVDTLAGGVECGTSGMPLVDPMDPEGSLLYQKLGETPPCGERMPRTGEMFTDPELTCLVSWIQSLE